MQINPKAVKTAKFILFELFFLACFIGLGIGIMLTNGHSINFLFVTQFVIGEELIVHGVGFVGLFFMAREHKKHLEKREKANRPPM
ncbi:hypothetical protein KSC_079790 [Ktedonobacter sp. SOSP1-52]|uniref:hypothetical protein n=1 Tax=Ktedonobacter sp. SOSP1-52 TaxID=2778366 RepID=UPI00191666BD|nr:hypothetical protein [Ktedonobacter sp. SOSP1-52]GHO69087.1 hypothetical protein KSC_079790 [Ktedonobacter sp. SOSP1-52]